MTTNSFNLKRFWQLLQVCLAGRQRAFATITVVAILLLLADKLVQMFFNHSFADSSFFLIIWIFVFNTVFCQPLAKREGGIRFLTLPVSNLERYVALIAINIVGFTLMLVVSVLGAEWLWQLAMLLLAPENYQGLLPPAAKSMILIGLGFVPMFALVFPLGFFGDNDRRGCLAKVMFGLLIGLSCVAFFILLIVGLPKLGFSHQATSAIVLTIAILALLLLQPKAYRHFCRSELDLEKSEE